MQVSVFYIDGNDNVLASVAIDIERLAAVLSVDQIARLEHGMIVEVTGPRDISAVAGAVSPPAMVGVATHAALIGLVESTFNDCMYECCGGFECSWGEMKYCWTKCSQDHEPKPNEQ